MTLLFLLACGDDCGVDDDCKVADGVYRAQVPSGAAPAAGWPVAFHFYGYQGTPEKSMGDTQALADMDGAGVLFVVPDHEDGWDFDGSGGLGSRDDRAFLDQVLDDLDTRWGIDRSQLLLTGHSVGGSAVHDLACGDPGSWTAAAPFAGVFWEPFPTSCTTPAIPLRHTHGLADTTWPWEGRSFGEHATQGDVGEALAFWVAERGCGADSTTETVSVSTCETWSGCTGDLQLCTHEGGHALPDDWAATSAAWLLGL